MLPAQCQHIQNEIVAFNTEEAELAAELQSAPPGQKPKIASQIKVLNKKIAQKKTELAACINKFPPPSTDPAIPISIAVKGLKCFSASESPRPFHFDEPYVVSLAVDLTPSFPGVRLPKISVIVTGAWSKVGAGSSGDTFPLPPLPPGAPQESLDMIPLVWRKHCWGLNGTPAPIRSPTDVMILVALMEEDNRIGDLKALASGIIAGDLGGMLNNNNGAPPSVDQVKHIFDKALGTAGFGFPDSDDLIGPSQELRLSQADLDAARTGTIIKTLAFTNPGSSYQVFVELTH